MNKIVTKQPANEGTGGLPNPLPAEVRDFIKEVTAGLDQPLVNRFTPAIGQIYRQSRESGIIKAESQCFDEQFKDLIRDWVAYTTQKVTGGVPDVVALNKGSFTARAEGYTDNQGPRALKNQEAINNFVAQWVCDAAGKGGKVLDAGTADGKRALIIAGKVAQSGGNYELYAVDLSPEMVLLARQNGIPHVEEGNFLNLPFGDTRFNAMTCLDGTIGHLRSEDRIQALQHWFDRIDDDGVLALDVFNQQGLFTVLTKKHNAIRTALGAHFPELREEGLTEGDFIYSVAGSPPCYIHHFKKDDIVSELRATGFEVSQLRTIAIGLGRDKTDVTGQEEDYNQASIVVLARKTKTQPRITIQHEQSRGPTSQDSKRMAV
ncbi:MAG: class I SAM-dependent methyltransferase [Candidatus Altiarchaeota archaeon]|nr:class I SAM-dependent methyltransferase [Candidatus Altiarchaeota archaeon]